MTPPRSVLVVGRGEPERGGIAVFLQQLTSADRPGWSFELLNLTRDEDMGSGGAFDLANVTRTLADTRRLFGQAAGHDLVHIHSALSPLPTLVRAGLLTAAAKLRGKPVVVHAHGGRLLDWTDREQRRRLVRIVLGRADRVIAVSSGVADLLRSALGDAKVLHVPNGVDTDVFRPGAEPPSVPTILYAGILSERKGVLDLVRASEALAERGVEHRTVLVGGRPDEGAAEYERVLAAIDESSAPLELVGAVDHGQIGEWYHEATVFCLPSWWEAMPLSVLEAMASGVPVVASDVGDVAATVGDSGRTVEPRNVEALVEALEYLLRDPQRAVADGAALRQRAEEQFGLDVTRAAIITCYEDVLT